MGKLGCQNSETPEPMDTKFGMGDYVGDIISYAKTHIDSPIEVVCANGWNITLAFIFCGRIFAHASSQNHTTDFYAALFVGH